MPKAGFIVARVSFLVITASMLGVAMLAAPAVGQANTCPSSGKCFAVAVSPSNPTGASTSFAFTITNEAATQQLGSAQISAPAGFAITSASGAASFTSSSALFLNLSVAPSATTTLTLTASAPCSGGAYQWGIEAKQSNDFNGSGNDFQLDPASAGNLNGTLTGSLAFTSEPTNTATGAAITSQGDPVKVEVLNGCGQLDTSSKAEVNVAIGPNSGSGTLSGTVMVAAIGGIASFSDLKINQPGGYTLVATSPGITSATSDSFTIFAGSSCTSSACSASASSATTSGTVTTSSATAGDSIMAEMESVNSNFSYNCPTYTAVADVFGFAVFTAKGAPDSIPLTVTVRIDKSLVSSTHPGASSWQICYASTTQFKAVPGTDTQGVTIGGTPGYFTGLLPDCSKTQGAPCVQSRNKNNAGDVIVTFLAFGDPFGHT
jgi:hypothetical protein